MCKKNKPDSSDMSFVVQGAVCGPTLGSNLYTKIMCHSIRKYFPKAEIILSTWKGEDVAGVDYDKIIYAAPIEMTYIIRDDGKVYPHTINHQIVTTKNGIALATRKYVVKVRSDLTFLGNGLSKFIGKYNDYSNSPEDNVWKIFSERILCLPTYNPRKRIIYPYNICDWIYIGKNNDIKKLFDIPLADVKNLKIRSNNLYPTIQDNMGAEQYIWTSCLRKNGLPAILDTASSTANDAIHRSEQSLANNVVLLSAKKLQLKSLKSGYSGYCSEPWLSQGFYTFCEWKRLYNKFAGGKCFFRYNPVEDILYQIVYNLRNILKTKNSKMYIKIVCLVRKIRGGI